MSIRKHCLLAILFAVVRIAGYTQNFGGNPSPASVKWKQINTNTVRVIFPNGLDSQANRIANVIKLLGETTAKTIGGNQKKWNVILQNQTTIPNAYVRLAPNMSEFYLTPDQNSFSNGSLRWDDNLTIHENRHMQQLSNFNKGFTRVFSFLMGQEGQLLANGLTVPDYFLEGDAVWQETLVSAHGRASLPSFYNGYKSLWLGNKNYSWMKLRNGSYKDFVPDHYALGYQMTAYGYEKYGENFWHKVTNDAVRFKGVLYPFNNAIKRYAGKSYRQFGTDARKNFKEKTLPAETNSVTEFMYLTKTKKNNVIDYQFPNYINDDSILIAKKAYNEVNAFYILSKEKETKLMVRDIIIDDYYSYKNGKIVYAAYLSDPRWKKNRDYSEIKLLDIYSGQQKKITHKTKYFSPDINAAGNEVLAVQVAIEGNCNLCRIDAVSGNLILKVPNPDRYFFTQTKYVDSNTAVTAVRNTKGNMALVKVDLTSGAAENLTPFSFSLIGYPFVLGDTIYFNASHENADKIFAVSLKDKKIYKLTDNVNGVYHPMVNTQGELFVSAFTAGGYRLARVDLNKMEWKEFPAQNFIMGDNKFFRDTLLKITGAGALNTLNDSSYAQDHRDNIKNPVTKYKKSFRLFNFHSWRPVVADPEYGYSIFSDNVLSSFTNTISYTYNRTDMSHTVGFKSAYGGWFPVLTSGIEKSFNRTVDTAFGKSASFNAATAHAGIYIPLRFVSGRTSQFLNFGGGYNIEHFYFKDVGSNEFGNKAMHYMNYFLNFSNVSQQASQHINPRWAQSVSFYYKDAFHSGNRHKVVANTSLFFPGLFPNHSLIINAGWQKRDTMPDLFSKTFSYSRGYVAISAVHMNNLAVNYQFPVMYPDWGFANLFYLQRIRANVFFDYTQTKAKLNNINTGIKNRSTGTEIYFDTKIWNSFPVSFGFRFSRLLDRDMQNSGIKNRWEFIVPIGFIPE